MDLPFDVSRETLERLRSYEALLLKWQRSHNLVSRETVCDVWGRHIVDSAQVLLSLSGWDNLRVADMGSGAGFPGMVLSILGVEDVTLLESNHKKCSFLREVKRQLNLPVKIQEGRIETLVDASFDVITSRALADLTLLLGYSYPLLSLGGACVFLKGKHFEQEIKEAREKWVFEVDKKESITSPGAAILILHNVRPKKHEDNFRCESKRGGGENHHSR